MMDPRVHLYEDWQTGGWRILVRARTVPGGPYLGWRADGQWEEIKEGGESPGVLVPEGVLDKVVEQYLKVRAPTQATQDHLVDAMAVRDRLLTLIEGGLP